ncbi:MAG: alpha/beta fold hydrolase [Gammaproteobacteria bacterium]|nr:alpha/beta fold hydrolase [Gammaproteobacteria bacterium]
MNQIAIESYGSGSPLVLFHGWGFDSSIWTPLLPDLLALPSAHQIILVDLPGFGQSPVLAWDEFKSQLLERLPEKFAIAGWSLGGLFATRLAIEAPQRITSLINIASSPYFISEEAWPGIDMAVLEAFYQRFQADPQQTLQQFVQAQVQKKWQYQGKEQMHGLEAGLLALKQWDFRAALQQCSMPITYIFGRFDIIVPYQLMTTMQSAYPNFRYALLPQAAHMPFLSHQQLFMNELKAILC